MHDQEFKERLVVPKSKRSMILKLAHEFSGHVGYKRMKVIIGTIFTWPNITKDSELHVKSSLTCAKVNKVVGYRQL